MKVNIPLVSVVITTKNEERNIRNCLQSIREQTYKNIEIIVVDNSSSDMTKKIANEFTKIVVNVGPERSAQRNFGLLKLSKGEILCYLDADMIASRFLIEDSVRFLQSTSNVGVYVPEIILGKSLFAKIRRFERQFYNGTVVDAARIFTRGSFELTGGFDEDLFQFGSGEDWDLDKLLKENGTIQLLPTRFGDSELLTHPGIDFTLSSKLGVSIDSTFNGLLHNESEDKFFNYLMKKRYYSTGFAGYVAKWGSADSDIRKQLGIRYRLVNVFFENGKWKKVIRNPHLFIAVIALKIAIVIVTISNFRKF